MSTSACNRDSSTELLRLFCMFFIVFHHILVLGAYPEILVGGSAVNGAEPIIATFINGFCFVAVDCFILISGYYRIRPNIRKFVYLYTFCAFYALLNYLCIKFSNHEQIGYGIIRSTFLCISHSQYWFIPCYFSLFLISPFINKIIDSLSKANFDRLIIILTIINVYIGYFGIRDEINACGYNLLQFIYLYIIGAYLEIHLVAKRERRYVYLAIYIVSAISWSLFTLNQNKFNNFSYNNPFVLIAAVALFLFSNTIHFNGKIVNYLSSSALAVYLIQSSPFIESILYPHFRAEVLGGIPYPILRFGLLSFFITLLCLFVDKLRVLIMKPFWHAYDKVYERIKPAAID